MMRSWNSGLRLVEIPNAERSARRADIVPAYEPLRREVIFECKSLPRNLWNQVRRVTKRSGT
jgi:hypothetical protein